MPLSLLTALLACVLLPSGFAAEDLVVRVYPLVGVRPLEPLAYGVNGKGFDGATFVRHGGNRITGFNWETGASHAGHDWRHQNDWYLADQPELRRPGGVIESWVLSDRQRGASTLLSIPLAGWVAADAAGPVREDDVAPSARFERLALRREGPPLLDPDLYDGVVTLEEQLRHLVRRFGGAADGGVLAYSLDNEPALWPHTHPRLHPQPTSWGELTLRSTEAAELITEIDPDAMVFGPALYGWAAHRDLQGAPDADPERESFTAAYLSAMAQASERAGRRLLHAYDMHWYPEVAVDGQRIVGDDTSPASCRARMLAPRSLWDPSYEEDSWVSDDAGGPITLIPRLQRLVDENYPGTRVALSEYNFGANGHASGGVAQADVLGILGRHGVIGNYWPMGEDQAYIEAAFALYLDEDGSGAHFGDTAIHATTSDRALSSVHASKQADDPQRIALVLLNRMPDEPLDADVLFAPGSGQVESLQAWRFDANGPELRSSTHGAQVGGEGFKDTLPPMSATLYVARLSAPLN